MDTKLSRSSPAKVVTTSPRSAAASESLLAHVDSGDDMEDEEYFSDRNSDVGDVVEEILDRRDAENGVEYYVRWECEEGDPNSECEWVCQNDMDGCEELISLFEQQRNNEKSVKQ